MKTRDLLSLLFAGATLVAGAPSTHAGDARMPVFQATTIVRAGSYYLTRDIDGSITITAPRVDLDLNGFVVRSGTTDPAIDITSPSDVRVRNGAVVDSSPGVRIRRTTGVTLEGLEIRGGSTGISGTGVSALRLVHCEIAESGGHGVDTEGGAVLLDGVRVDDAASGGIRVDSARHGSLVIHASIGASSAIAPGIDLTGGTFRIARNVIRGDLSSGIDLSSSQGCIVRGNVIEGVAVYGVKVSPSAGGTLVAGNTASDAPIGFMIEGSTVTLAGNLANTGVTGIEVIADDVVLRRNVARGNGNDIYVGGAASNLGTAGDNYLPNLY